MNIKIRFQNLVYVLSLAVIFQILGSCQTGKQSSASDYRLQLGDLESIIQSGNWLKFYTDYRVEPYTGTLNPGRMTSRGRKYHILKYENRDQDLPYTFEDNDTLTLIIDGRPLYLTGYNTSGGEERKKLNIYYDIDMWDLADIGNASSVSVILKAKEGELKAKFSKDNIYNYKYFSAKYILGTDEVPPPVEPPYKQPLAFASAGVGTGFEFWFGYYTNFLKITQGLGDYFGLGMGFIKFNYSTYNRYPGQGYLWDGSFSKTNYSINLMYGLTYPSPFGNWSFELGFTYQYYFYDKSWNSKNTGSESFPTYYQLEDYNPHEGSVIGLFIQAGGFWMQFNRRRDWAVGVALPIPWW
jgi:hypothetical protein